MKARVIMGNVKTTPLFQGKIDGLLHGGDYNPEQWLDRPDILEEDIRLMKEAGVNTATLGVFSWSVLEPQEGCYDFGWLSKIVDDLYQNGIYTVLATPSAARPAWLDEKYPEAMRVAADGRRNHHGVRHNHCLSSNVYREKVRQIVGGLVENVARHPGVILWHISNELGGACWCESCCLRFTEYLRNYFDNDIDKLNHAWWTTFWSHRYSSFEQVEPPWPNGETSIQGLHLAWKRFITWNMNDYLMFEANLLRSLTPEIPVTTNFMRLYDGLDYSLMAGGLDIISWDTYPEWCNDYETLFDTAASSAFDHAVMRGLKPHRPYLLMESTPSLVNWHPYNTLKRPGVHMLSSLQAIAAGSDSVQYFQWRKSRGSYEQYHGAVVDHLGRSDTRVFREVAQVGDILKKLAPVTGSLGSAKAAVLFDWDNRWAIQDMAALSKDKKNYEETCRGWYKLFARSGIPADVVSPLSDLSCYDLVVAPMLYMIKPGVAASLEAFTRKGGQLIATYLMGYVDENTLNWLGGFPGDGLTNLFGLYSEEIDSLYPGSKNAVDIGGKLYEARDFCEILKVQDAQVLGAYAKDFYAGTPAVTRRGNAWYIAARLSLEGNAAVLSLACKAAGLTPQPLPQGVEYHYRQGESQGFSFYLNWTDDEVDLPSVPVGVDLTSGERTEGCLKLAAHSAAVIAHLPGA
jgi:beta-galactosidase